MPRLECLDMLNQLRLNAMRHNFDEIVNRKNTNAMNTDGFRSYIFHAGPEKKL